MKDIEHEVSYKLTSLGDRLNTLSDNEQRECLINATLKDIRGLRNPKQATNEYLKLTIAAICGLLFGWVVRLLDILPFM